MIISIDESTQVSSSVAAAALISSDQAKEDLIPIAEPKRVSFFRLGDVRPIIDPVEVVFAG